MASRWRREDHHKVRHDKCFSDWKVLVSPSDWQASTSGRASEGGGGERLRSRSLPGAQVGSGVYELGVTLRGTLDDASLKSEDIVVVYVGYAEHMRKRLQRYSQAGANLDNPRSPVSPPSSSLPELSFANLEDISEEQPWKIDRRSNSSSAGAGRRGSRGELQTRIPIQPVFEPVSSARSGSPRGPRLFSEVFNLGCSIACRWSSTRSKEVAEFVVQNLTDVFDYAWKSGGNTQVRSQDILDKVVLGKRAPAAETSCCSSRWRSAFPFRRKPAVGIRIAAAHRPPSSAKPRKSSSFLMVLRRSPQLMVLGGKPSKHSAFTKMNIPVERCGVVLDSGLVCSGLPQKGHKRCPTHMIEAPPRRVLWCFPLRCKKAKSKEPKRKGSISFSTWLTRSSVEFKNKSIEWLIAMEEIKGRSYNTCSTSPILKPELFSPEVLEALPPNWMPKLSLSGNLTMEPPSSPPPDHYPKVDHGMPYSIVSKGSPVRWRDQESSYTHRYLTPQFYQG